METPEEESSVSLEAISNLAFRIAKKHIHKDPETVISVEKEEGEWKVVVEALERKAVPDSQDVLGRYEIRLNKKGELTGWKQKLIRKRGDRMIPPGEDWVVTG